MPAYRGGWTQIHWVLRHEGGTLTCGRADRLDRELPKNGDVPKSPMTIGDATIGNVDDAVAYVLSATPRLATVTNLTVISFSFLEGARKAFISAPNVTEDTREVADEYCIACEHMTAVRLHLLLDKDEKGVSFQTVYHRLKLPEVAEALAQHMGDDPFQPQHIEDDVRHSINQFLCVYRAIDWRDLHGRLTHFRNQGIVHLSKRRPTKTITQDELRTLVGVVKALSESLAVFQSNEPPIQEDEITDRSNRATAVWQAALRVGGEGAPA